MIEKDEKVLAGKRFPSFINSLFCFGGALTTTTALLPLPIFFYYLRSAPIILPLSPITKP